MEIKDRQKKILLTVVNEYIKTGEPVSSLALSRKYNFGISPAMIRWELLDLEQMGYLIHPYTSSGRIPTEKAYRFFVNDMLEKKLEEIKNHKIKMIENILLRMKEITQVLREFSEISKSHLLWFEEDLNSIYESSLSETLSFFDFDEQEDILDFIRFIEEVKSARESIIEDFKDKEISVFIGDEFPYEVNKEFLSFALMGVKGSLPKFGSGTLLMVGPQRMNYEDNLIILKKIKELSR